MINDATCPNSVSWGNLFVTVFAVPNLLSNYFFKALNFNLLSSYSFRGHINPYWGTWQDTKHLNYLIIYQLSPCTAIVIKPSRTVMANIAPYPAAHRDSSMLTTGTINRWISPGNANSLNCRAVRLSKNLSFLLITMRLVILQKAISFVPWLYEIHTRT